VPVLIRGIWEVKPMRRFVLSSVLAAAMFVMTVVTVLADSTGPGY
jgi:hypothetical protein